MPAASTRRWRFSSGAPQFDPASAEAYNLLGLAFLKQGRTNEAIESFRQALARKPDYAEAFQNLQEASLETWRVAVRLMPYMAQTHCELADALANQGKYDEAIASYEQALRLQPGYARARQNLASTQQAKQDRPPDSSTPASGGVNPRRLAEAFNDQAVALAGQGRRQEAVATYQQALRRSRMCSGS